MASPKQFPQGSSSSRLSELLDPAKWLFPDCGRQYVLTNDDFVVKRALSGKEDRQRKRSLEDC